MSEALTTIEQGQPMQISGIGMGAAIFKARPQNLELVQRTTRQEGAIPGKFRVIATNEHMDEIRVVLLAVPLEQREWYSGAEFSKDSKQCFSLDNVQPHPKAKNPPALYCATCPKGDINWEKWRKSHKAEDLPPCSMYYHLYLAERTTQTQYYFNVKGTSVMPFKNAMETQMGPLLQKILADIRAKNKVRGYTFVPSKNIFVDTPDFVVPEGKTKEPALPLPNIFDVSFTMFVTSREKGGPPVLGVKDFKLMNDADRAEFGALYQERVQRNLDHKAMAEEQM